MEYEAVIDQLTEKMNAEVDNQLQVYLASFRVNATTFYNDMIGALRAANRVCNGRGNECLSDLGAFLSGELIKEEQEQSNDEEQQEEDASTAEEEAAPVDEEAAPTDEEEAAPADEEAAVDEEAAPVEEGENADDEGEAGDEEAAPADEAAAPADEEAAPADEEAAPAEEEAAPAEEEAAAPADEEAAPADEEPSLDNVVPTEAAPATPVSAVAAAFRGSKRISKALFNEALRAYNSNRFRSKQNKIQRKNNMVQVPIF